MIRTRVEFLNSRNISRLAEDFSVWEDGQDIITVFPMQNAMGKESLMIFYKEEEVVTEPPVEAVEKAPEEPETPVAQKPEESAKRGPGRPRKIKEAD